MQNKSIANVIKLAVVYSHRGNAFKLKRQFNLAKKNYNKALVIKLKLADVDAESSPLVVVTY